MEKEKAKFFRASKLDDLLVFQANYRKFRFSRHVHEDFALGVMLHGVQKIHCRGECYYARPGDLISVNADEVHDGMSADGGSYHYAIIYIPESLLREMTGGQGKATGRHQGFLQPVTRDKELALELGSLFSFLGGDKTDELELQSFFSILIRKLLQRHGTGFILSKSGAGLPEAVNKAVTFIHDMATQQVTLADISAAAGLSRYHFLRLFQASKGMTPHSYLLQCRLQRAKESLRQGVPIADTAFATCFADQSHFTKRFKSAFGITPAQYQKAVCQD
ncbi:MAG: AraC family transcriptional regulator [Desulfocapsaceae bacterium]|nr:AraC family transcriptional regulator [Desulfocapsaceae bacterium]